MADENFMPLAARQAPKTIEDFAGQPHLLGPGKCCAACWKRIR